MNNSAKYIAKVLLFALVMIFTCQAAESTKTVKVNSTDQGTSINAAKSSTVILPINADLLSIINQLKQTVIYINELEASLAQLTLSKKPLNVAEQYLLLVAQASIKQKDLLIRQDSINDNNITDILMRAEKLSVNISQEQLVHPDFLQLHLILANYYLSIKNYDLAYLEKEKYLNKYHIYRKNKRSAMIDSIEETFDVEDKKASNALLKSQNESKSRRVAEFKGEKADQQYNAAIIIGTAIIFILLFFRQLRVRNKLIRLTKIDALTGLPNRNSLFEYGKQMTEDFIDKPDDLSILILDLDQFKKINENFDHNVGDQVLTIVSSLVKETMRSRDIFSRLGGEEFVALLPYADTHKAKAIAMRINEKIAEYDFSSLLSQYKVTASIGVATLEKNQQSFDDLLHCADLAMYQAKGGNTVVCYQNIASAQERRAN